MQCIKNIYYGFVFSALLSCVSLHSADMSALSRVDWKTFATTYRTLFANNISIRACLVRLLLNIVETPRSYSGLYMTMGQNHDGKPIVLGPLVVLNGPLYEVLPREIVHYLSLLHPDQKFHWIVDLNLKNRRHQLYLAAGVFTLCCASYIVVKTGCWAASKVKKWIIPHGRTNRTS